MKFGIGQPATRFEDRRFLTGRGRYVDDIVLPSQAWGVVVRSPHAAADIRGIDAAAARASTGVLAVLVADDLTAAGIGDIACRMVPQAFGGGAAVHWPSQPVLARDRVRHVGEPVAFVVAETRALAEDAAEKVVVDYAERPAVVATAEAMNAGAPAVWDEAPDNRCFTIERGDRAAADSAFARARHTVRLRLVNNRVAPNAIEPRASLAASEPADGRITLYTASQNPHGMRAGLAQVLGAPEAQIRVVSPDVGGGFGLKNNVFPEDVLCVHAARLLGRPVRWTATRAESLLADHHGRDMVCDAELALDADGRFLALRARSVYAMGAYLSGAAPVPVGIGTTLYAGAYALPAVHLIADCVFTNTTYTGPYRGAGRPEAAHLVERLVDQAARECGFDPAELRRRNFVTPEQMPYRTPVGASYDSGEFATVMDKCLTLADWDGFAERKDQSEDKGLKRGRGLAYFIETGAVFNDRMELRFDTGGTLTILAGTHNHGQGHETVYRQMAADWLGIDAERIRFVQGDTDQVAFGRGTYASRSMTIGGSALRNASDRLIEKAREIAGVLFEAAPHDIEFEDGSFSVAGTDRSAGWSEILQAAYAPMGPTAAFGPGLEAVGAFAPSQGNFPNGCHVAEVEVDPETGAVRIDSYTAVDDSGRIINPLLYSGQIHGGLAQGIGQALMEDVVYDLASGQLVSGSFMDYAMPRAADFPDFVLGHHEVPCTTNPLGVKGGGESGTVGALPAVVNAAVDALAGYGVNNLDMPLSPGRVWQAIRGR